MTPLSGFHVTRRVYGFDAPISDVAPLERLGGKGLALRRLVQLGCDVPPGLTITTDAVAELIAAPDAWPKLYAELEPELQRLADRTQSAWGCGPKPLTLAIRSGAVQSQPGLMRTLLHCGWTTALAEASATLDGWREFAAFLAGLLPASPQSNALRGEAEATNAATSPATLHDLCQTRMQALKDSGLAVEDRPDAWLRLAIEHVAASAREATPPLRTAITVQAMFTAEMSGVLRSRDPLHPDADEMVVEAVAGDGLALMSGGSTPMIWRMPRDPDRIGGAVGDEAIPLSSSAQQRLHQAALRIEHAAGQTVEMEWGVAGDRLVLFQFRPAQDALQYIPSLDREIHNIRELAWEGRRLWVRHQLAEALPLPTPLTWSVWDQFASPQGGLGELYRRLGYAPRVFADGGGCLALLAGRIYADPDRWAQLIASSFPLRHDADQLAARPELFLEAPTTIDPQRLDPWLLLKWPHLLWVVLRAARRSGTASAAVAPFEPVVRSSRTPPPEAGAAHPVRHGIQGRRW